MKIRRDDAIVVVAEAAIVRTRYENMRPYIYNSQNKSHYIRISKSGTAQKYVRLQKVMRGAHFQLKQFPKCADTKLCFF